MEVHHHPDLHHEKKNLKEYFLEFLMIFFAVTMGFFAENIREHFVNKEKERQYIKSFVEDLSSDESQLPILIGSIERQQIQAADSLPLLFSKVTSGTPANAIYYLLRGMIRQQGVRVYITDRTIEQAKNSGEMRLISNKQISDSLVDYYKEIGFIDYLQQFLVGYKSNLNETFPIIFKSDDFNKVADSTDHIVHPNKNLYLASTDSFAINKILIEVSEIKGLSISIKKKIEKAIKKEKNIKKLIAAKYDIEK